MGCRKNLTKLTLAERTAFVNAVVSLKNSGGYDTFIDQHQGAMGHGHGGPAFFPWHREYILRFEKALQAIDSSVNLPYWDWTQGNLNAAGTESLIWRNELMGGPGNPASGFQLQTGPFATWGIRRNNFNIFSFPGGGGTINGFLGQLTYTQFRGVEGPHGGAHIWIGGHMGNAAIAPTDPVFFLLHCNVDRLWSVWINMHQGDAGFTPYQPAAGGPTGHNLNDTMWPWNGTTNPFGMFPWTVTPEMVRPADLLDHRALGYFYDEIDPECRPKPLKERLTKEILKERIKENFKERLPKELLKDRTPKELLKDRLPKELKENVKERSPKELKEIREVGPFIREEIRPDILTGGLSFEPDLNDTDLIQLREEMESRAREARAGGHLHTGTLGP